MDALFLLQYTCFVLSSLLALLLVVSKFLQTEVTREYRRAGWLLISSMLLLAVHYVLQMTLGLRSYSDELGTVFNILFYTPVAFLVSCSVTMQLSSRQRFRRYALTGAAGSLLEILVFFVGWSVFGHFLADSIRYTMHALFFISMVYYIYFTMREILRNNKRIVDDTGGDIAPYERYASSSYLLLSSSSFVLVFVILWRPALFVAAPLLLLSLFIYVASFAALGFNMSAVDEVLADDDTGALHAGAIDEGVSAEGIYEKPAVAPAEDAETQTAPAADTFPSIAPSDSLMLHIEEVLGKWIADGGFRDPTINIGRLAQITSLPRADLSLFFYSHLHSTFRKWLSDIRFAAAQRMIHDHPEYSNDTVSTSCGFSSRSQLYRIFSDRVGMSPREWHEKNRGE